MYDDKNIVENAVNSTDHTTLVAAVQASGLVENLQGEGPFAVFAPTNAAFDMLASGTVENPLKQENKATLTKVLTCHVIGKIILEGERGRHATVTIAAVKKSNGVIHVIDAVLLPK